MPCSAQHLIFLATWQITHIRNVQLHYSINIFMVDISSLSVLAIDGRRKCEFNVSFFGIGSTI